MNEYEVEPTQVAALYVLAFFNPHAVLHSLSAGSVSPKLEHVFPEVLTECTRYFAPGVSTPKRNVSPMFVGAILVKIKW